MASPRSPRQKRKGTNSSAFLQALEFVSVAQEKKGELAQTHCTLKGKYVVASDGIMSAGHLIEEDIYAQPHTLKLIDALSKCEESLTLTQLDESNINVKSGKFNVNIPCTPEFIPEPSPDPVCAVIDDKLKTAFSAVAPLVKEESQIASKASVMLRSGSVVSTDHQVIIECWHGFNLPATFILPKGFVTAILRCAKPLEHFGCSRNSVTFYFNDNSWIKTQLLDPNCFPDVDKILNVSSNPWPVPVGLYKGFSVVASFSDNKIIYFRKNQICSHNDPTQGASFEVDGLPDGLAFKAEHLKFVEGKMTSVDFTTQKHAAMFFGEGLRGAIIKMVN